MKLFISLLLLLAAAFATTGAAQAWPSRPIRLIVPFPPGGSTDSVARLLGQRLGERLGQAVVVDNKPGAAGNLGTDVVAKAAADGYTLALSTSGPLANNQHLYPAMPFDPARDLTPVALVGEIPLVLAANPSLKVSRLKEFLALARSRPKGLAVAP
jgi:tripartite-type tricarboxylate transporter receptor subunit TctC